jgi:RNA polymerase sigma-70 factor, ECF subfamily
MDMTREAARSTVAREASLTDEEIVGRVLAGETALFELIMRRHNAQLFRATRSILRDDAEAEDAVQQAYISAYEHLAQFHGDARLATWLTRIAIRAALDRARAAQRRAEIHLITSEEERAMAPAAGSPDPEAAAASGELRLVVEQAVDRLPEIYRVVFMLREVQQVSTAEAASILEVSEEVIKVRLHRAKQLLRTAIETQLDAVVPEVFSFLGERCERIVAGVMARIRAQR